MHGNRVAAFRFDVSERSLEPLVAECFDCAAFVANEVVVVAVVVADRFEAGDAVAELQPLEQPSLGQRVEHAVDTREADRPSGRA